MRKGTMIATGIAAVLVATGVAAMNGAFDNNGDHMTAAGGQHMAAAKPDDCRAFASTETGFDPATTPVPIHEDAGNKQVLKGTGVGAAVGAISGELIGGKPGLGAAAGAAAGAAGGQAIKVDKQGSADERFEQQSAQYQQQKAAYDAALTECSSS